MSKKNQLTKTDYLELSEYHKLVNGLHEDHDVLGETYTRIAKATALRVSDVLKLTWKKIMVDRFMLNEQKTGKLRPIFVPDKTQEVFRSLYRLNGSPDVNSLVFLNKRNNKAYTGQYINQRMKIWKKRYHINVGNFSTHTYRKSFGREFWDKSGRSEDALVRLCEIYNHSDISITRRYLGIRDEEIRDAYYMIDV